jgi:hypothetical protein
MFNFPPDLSLLCAAKEQGIEFSTGEIFSQWKKWKTGLKPCTSFSQQFAIYADK